MLSLSAAARSCPDADHHRSAKPYRFRYKWRCMGELMALAKRKPKVEKKMANKKTATRKAGPSRRRSNHVTLLKMHRPNLVSQLSFGAGEKLSPRLQAVVDKNEIAHVLAVFARGIDRVDENLLRSVLNPDATLDLGPGIFQGTGGDYVN